MVINPPAEHAGHAPSRGDRAWAWAGALLAAGVSVAVNIAHASPHVPSAYEAAELVKAGLPVPHQVGSWGFAAFAATLPVMVLIAAEQVARRLLGRATLPVMLGIGVCAYSLSFWHTVLLLASWGEPWLLRVTGAVAVDGLAVASVIALWFANRPMPGRPDVHPAAEPDGRHDATTDARPDAAEATRPDAEPDAPARTVGARPDVEPGGRPDSLPVRTHPFVLPDALRPAEPARTVGHANGAVRTLARTAVAERPASGRTAWADAPDAGLPEADVWKAWEAAGRPNDWPTLAALLGTNPEAARKRAGRRTS
jgi:hypothetical protein